MEKFVLFFYELDEAYSETEFDTLKDANSCMNLLLKYHSVPCAGTIHSWNFGDDNFGSETRSTYFDLEGNVRCVSTVVFQNGQCVLEEDKNYS